MFKEYNYMFQKKPQHKCMQQVKQKQNKKTKNPTTNKTHSD